MSDDDSEPCRFRFRPEDPWLRTNRIIDAAVPFGHPEPDRVEESASCFTIGNLWWSNVTLNGLTVSDIYKVCSTDYVIQTPTWEMGMIIQCNERYIVTGEVVPVGTYGSSHIGSFNREMITEMELATPVTPGLLVALLWVGHTINRNN
jgi:hypothetical protein